MSDDKPREGREQRKIGCRQWPYPTAHGAMARVCEHCHAADVTELNAREATIAALREKAESFDKMMDEMAMAGVSSHACCLCGSFSSPLDNEPGRKYGEGYALLIDKNKVGTAAHPSCLRAHLDSLRADVERLTRERDALHPIIDAIREHEWPHNSYATIPNYGNGAVLTVEQRLAEVKECLRVQYEDKRAAEAAAARAQGALRDIRSLVDRAQSVENRYVLRRITEVLDNSASATATPTPPCPDCKRARELVADMASALREIEYCRQENGSEDVYSFPSEKDRDALLARILDPADTGVLEEIREVSEALDEAGREMACQECGKPIKRPTHRSFLAHCDECDAKPRDPGAGEGRE